MAKSSKPKTAKSKIDKTVTDAVEVVDQDVSKIDLAESEDTTDDVSAAGDVPDDEDGLDLDTTASDDFDIEIVDDAAADQVDQPITDISVQEPTPVDDNARGGFVPLLLGGIVAGAIGYGIATYYPLNGTDGSDELSAQLNAQADQIAALEAQNAATPAPDLSEIEAQIANVEMQASEQIGGMTSSFTEQLSAFDDRLSNVEKAPGADGTLSDTALAAYQRELDQLRTELMAQQENVMSAAAQAAADLAAARQEAALFEQEAIATANAAATRAALNRVATAVETGAPFEGALADIGDADLPVALTNSAETGVATTAQLIQEFPAAARSALATARSEGVSDDADGFSGFFRSQFDVRSTAPQEGAGPDAVLSRAEAAIKEGRVADALAEIEALPEVARAEMTDWTARATERADVLDAIATLSETYN